MDVTDLDVIAQRNGLTSRMAERFKDAVDPLTAIADAEQRGAEAERAAIVRFIQREGGMDWLVQQLECGDHRKDDND